MDFILVRHGSTDWNVEKRIQGREDISLNEDGIRQCENCRDGLKKISFDRIVSSPLKRAIETAEIISGGQAVKKIELMDEFIERDFGKWSGLTVAERDVLRLLQSNEDMESIENVQRRALRGLSLLAADPKAEKILVVTHGGVINALLKKIQGTSFVEKVLTNTGITFLHEDNGRFENIHVFNSGKEFSDWYSMCT